MMSSGPFFFLIIFLGSFRIHVTCWSLTLEEVGPSLVEWPAGKSVLIPSFTTSHSIVPCRAKGTPLPKITWISQSLPLNSKFVGPDGALEVKDGLSGTVRCEASNNVGIVLSPPVTIIKALDTYRVENKDVTVFKGNTALLRCEVEISLKEFITVNSWVQDGVINIYPSSQPSKGKYWMVPNGDLYVFNIDESDGYKRFACRTSLRDSIRTSDTSKIIIKSHPSPAPVSINSGRRLELLSREGQDIIIPCTASALPPPNFTWRKEGSKREFGRTGGPLILSSVKKSDSGFYICEANNSESYDSIRISLTVYAPISVSVHPPVNKVDVGKTASFTCQTGTGEVEESNEIVWFKDGKELEFESGQKSNYDIQISPVRLSDTGMYQCFVSNKLFTSQAAGQLRIGSIIPQFVYRFAEQTLQPGPFVSLKCIAVGTPPPSISWARDGFPLPESERFLVGQYVTIHDKVISHLNITNVDELDGGVYSCTAKNSYGLLTHQDRLNIYGPPKVRSTPSLLAVSGKRVFLICPASGYPIEAIKWERGGKEIRTDGRQTSFPNGTLAIERLNRKNDEGTYTCTVRNRQGISASGAIHVAVQVPPRIIPFGIPDELLLEGMRAGMICQVVEGDTPITFTWTLDGNPIVSNSVGGIIVRLLDDYSSSLVIESLVAENSGVYTCTAQNTAGIESHSLTLNVNVPPKWRSEPTDVSVIEGSSVGIPCTASGHPTPNITWKKGLSSGGFKSIGVVWKNGSLWIGEARKEDEGSYVCEARNGVGSGISKLVGLSVNVRVRFIEERSDVSVRSGERGILQCKAKGDGPLEISWSNGHINIRHGHRYNLRQTNVSDVTISELVISDVRKGDMGLYTCRGSNKFGSDTSTVSLNVLQVPERPSNLRLVEVKSRSIFITWSAPDSISSDSFILQYKFPSETWTEIEVREERTKETSLQVEGLAPSTTYIVRVLALNPIGYSSPSETLSVTTQEESPEGVPSNVRIESLSSTAIQISWSSPDRNLWHGNLLGYNVGFKVDDGGRTQETMSGWTFKMVSVGDDFGATLVLDGLKKYTSYLIIVKAFNGKGNGPPSFPVVGRTLQDAPSMPPENVGCEGSSKTLVVSWEDPPVEGRNGVIQGYKLTLDSPNGSEVKLTTTRVVNLEELIPASNYTISVLAFTSFGDGVSSNPIVCKTNEDVPGEIERLKGSVSSKRSIVISWRPPAFTNGHILKYSLYSKERDGGKIERKDVIDDEKLELTNLKEGAYDFWISGWTRVGEGPPSHKIRISTAGKVPAKIVSFGDEIRSPWKSILILPCESVGLPKPIVSWRFNGNPLMLASIGRKTTNGDFDNLRIEDTSLEDEGNYTCITTNIHGTDSITFNLRIQVPPSPPKLEITKASFDYLVLSWFPTEDGGSRITGYRINYKKEGGDWNEFDLGPRESKLTIKNLQCGSKYFVYVTAYNKIGPGHSSDIFKVSTLGGAPTQQNDGISLINATTVQLNMATWTSDCPIKKFHIELKPAKGSKAILDLHGETKSHFIENLKSNTEYELSVTAVSDAGSSVASFEFITGASSEDPPEESTFGKTLIIVIPIIMAFVAVCGMFWVLLKRKSTDDVRTSIGSFQLAEMKKYEDDVCPYATFQLPEKPPNRPNFNLHQQMSSSETLYNAGNIYSGPYHAVQGFEAPTLQMRDDDYVGGKGRLMNESAYYYRNPSPDGSKSSYEEPDETCTYSVRIQPPSRFSDGNYGNFHPSKSRSKKRGKSYHINV